ncbi:protein disulfide oxidoreductase [Halapricum hydrolyticum]|uniref:Thioredoxin family protein n=1 Tax=Halapricum hydrolyticum TaxID=2979991 RepID=A0AAE3IGZ0_9EURY|nr:thioredoxin family protein [Halapricum hydrolyticum]MCU4719563.1 thioredoxin family protein [Halapricum hydrolyticum]MCU4728494.1 thioredoxin family protein [Halapricum hydrolyticum]
MSVLSADDRSQVNELLSSLEETVTVHVFTEDGCQYCEETLDLYEDVEGESDNVVVETHGMDDPLAEELGATKYDGAPVTVITRDGVTGVRYFGIPSGQEFSAFLQGLIAVAQGPGETDLPDEVREQVQNIDQPVDIKVFVTPTCPHCPRAVQVAHQMAIENDQIEADGIESQEFMELSQEYGVRGVPQINVNDSGQFTGGLPPQQFVDEVLSTLE